MKSDWVDRSDIELIESPEFCRIRNIWILSTNFWRHWVIMTFLNWEAWDKSYNSGRSVYENAWQLGKGKIKEQELNGNEAKIMSGMLTTAIIHNKAKRACYRQNTASPVKLLKQFPVQMILGSRSLGVVRWWGWFPY